VTLAVLVGVLAVFPDGCDCGGGTRVTGGAGGQSGTAGAGKAGAGGGLAGAAGGKGGTAGGGPAGAPGGGGGGGQAGGAGAAGAQGGAGGLAGSAAGAGGNAGAGGVAADAGSADAGAACSYGVAASQATANDLSLFGTPAYFNDGQPVPAGTYVVTYVDGCMKYGSGQAWTVNAYADGTDGWWLIGATTSDKILVLPGTVGYVAGSGGFDVFEDCVSASKLSAPVTFTHAGGVLGVWLQDTPYSDNSAGTDDRNPAWSLRRVDCADGGATDSGVTDGGTGTVPR
jgi:hypothetical protein